MTIHSLLAVTLLAWSPLAFSAPIPFAEVLESSVGKYFFDKTLSKSLISTIGATDSAAIRQLNGNMDFANALTKSRFKFVRQELEERMGLMREAFAEKKGPKRAKAVFEGAAKLRAEESAFLDDLAVEFIDNSQSVKFYAQKRMDSQGFASSKKDFFELEAPAQALPDRIESIRQWNGLGEPERQILLRKATVEVSRGIEWRKYKSVRSIQSAEQKAFAQDLLKQAREVMPNHETLEMLIKGNVAVGAPKLSIELYTLSDGKIIGGKVRYTQYSAQVGRRSLRFKTMPDALRVWKQNPDLLDYGWEWELVADAQGRPVL